MGNVFERGTDVDRCESAITALIASTSASAAEVRKLFNGEYERLALHAKVRAHLLALTISNVRQLLHRVDVTPQLAA